MMTTSRQPITDWDGRTYDQMPRERPHTIHSGLAPLGPMRWGIVLALFAAGCAVDSVHRSSLAPSQPSNRHPAVVSTTTNEPVRKAAEAELGQQAAVAIPHVERPAPQLVDAGAAAVVQAIANRLSDPQVGPDGVIHIGLTQVRNQSRATAAEYSAFIDLFADLLTRAANADREAGISPRIEFTGEPRATVQYQLQGAAYTISTEGFDVWELFLSMSPASKDWAIWQADRSIRVLRQARPGQPQVVSW